MLTLNEFIILPFEEQCDFIALGGDYLARRKYKTQKIYLYYLSGFFIEVYYCTEDDEIIRIEGFKNTESLTPYLKQIELAGLFV